MHVIVQLFDMSDLKFFSMQHVRNELRSYLMNNVEQVLEKYLSVVKAHRRLTASKARRGNDASWHNDATLISERLNTLVSTLDGTTLSLQNRYRRVMKHVGTDLGGRLMAPAWLVEPDGWNENAFSESRIEVATQDDDSADDMEHRICCRLRVVKRWINDLMDARSVISRLERLAEVLLPATPRPLHRSTRSHFEYQ